MGIGSVVRVVGWSVTGPVVRVVAFVCGVICRVVGVQGQLLELWGGMDTGSVVKVVGWSGTGPVVRVVGWYGYWVSC